MIGQNIINQVLDRNFNKIFDFKDENKTEYHRFIMIKEFLMREDFNGFTSDDLFIMQFIKKGWGHDIAALSNMAEAIVNLSIKNPKDQQYKRLLKERYLALYLQHTYNTTKIPL